MYRAPGKRAMRRLLLSAVAAALLAAAGWIWLDWHHRYSGFSQPVIVEIRRGMSLGIIARTLKEAGVIRHRWSFELLCLLRGHSRLQAGEYRFDRPLTPLEVYDWLAHGRVWVVSVTVPEGWTRLDIAAELDRLGLVGREAFLRATADPGLIRDLAPRAPSLEGFLFPATYWFPHRITAEAIAAAMVHQFRREWQKLTAGLPKPPDTLAAVTLASLVEAETARPTERPVIAGVFENRLRAHLPLDCDPTIVYALRLAGKYEGELDASALRFRSPYNTYLHPGLPPGPIDNPGRAALVAALKPAAVPFLYFVADGNGGHVFSRTLAEHHRNVARYRQQRFRERHTDGDAAAARQRALIGRDR